MMSAVIALLLGLASLSYGDKVLEFESLDSAEQDPMDPSYNGIIIAVYQDSESSPTIALGNELDSFDNVYCLNFVGLFEASSYDTATTTSGEFTEIDDTRVDLADANCTTSRSSDTQFTIACNEVGADDATLTLTFVFTEDSQGDSGLEYTINLEGYTLSDSTAKLVMVQSVKECSDLFDIDSSSSEGTTEAPDATEAGDDMESTEIENESTETRRRMPEETEDEESETTEAEDTETEDTETDEESLEEDDGLSSDSGEFDAGFARFVVHGQALDTCENTVNAAGDPIVTEIESALVYQKDDDELHIVFASFSCELSLDPFYGLDGSKYESVYGTPTTTEDKAACVNFVFGLIVGLIAIAFN